MVTTWVMNDKIKMRDGDTMLIMVKDGAVIHFTPNMSLPHSEFVKRTTRQLPEGAWVGTVSKLDGEVAAITSKHFLDISFQHQPRLWRQSGRYLNDMHVVAA
jgi:hypothetical protein